MSQASKAVENFYRPGLDLLRLTAFFLVFLAHGLLRSISLPTHTGAIARAGEFGVCIFFFLSSYLITELLIREKSERGTIAIPAFYVRRALRIWPLYFAMIAVGWLYGLVSASHTLSPGWLLALLLLCSNWYTVGHGYPPGFLFPLWSVALEEQFYLLWPWLVRSFPTRALLAFGGSVIALSYVSIAVLIRRGASLDPGLWVNSLVQFQFFALGAVTALLLRGRMLHFSAALRVLLFAAGLLCLRGAQAAVYMPETPVPKSFWHIAPCYLLAMVACLCLFFSMQQTGTGRLQRPFLYLGKISYGLYVFHIVWLNAGHDLLRKLSGERFGGLGADVAVMAVALPATIMTAMLSYRLLESPFLRLKKRFTIVSSRPV